MVKPKKRPQVGDVLRITAPEGHAAFVQYTHRHGDMGALVRVIGPADSSTDPAVIAARPTQFVTFFPLGAACQRGIAAILGAAPIPEDHVNFPTFRQALRLDPASTSPCQWRLWNGLEEWVVPLLRDEQWYLPIRVIMNDTMLVEYAHAGWTAEQAR